MKKSIVLALLSLFLNIFLSSCSKEESKTPPTVLLKKYINTDKKEGIQTFTFTYDGNKIKEINAVLPNETFKEVFTYTGDLITKEEIVQNGVVSTQTEYNYENNKLKSQIYTEVNYNYKLKSVFIYNVDGTITIEKYNIDKTTGVETKKNTSSVFSFSNGNLIKKIETSNGISDTTTYEYDTKNHPFKNILGLSKLINSTYQTNNELKETIVGSNYSEVWINEYVYNADGYPTDLKYTKTQTYNDSTISTSEGTIQFFY